MCGTTKMQDARAWYELLQWYWLFGSMQTQEQTQPLVWTIVQMTTSTPVKQSQHFSFLAWIFGHSQVRMSPGRENLNTSNSDPHLLITLIRHYSARGVRLLLFTFSEVFCLEKQHLYYSLQMFCNCSHAGAIQPKTIILQWPEMTFGVTCPGIRVSKTGQNSKTTVKVSL